MMTLEEFAHLRRDLKLSQEQMAEELGLSRQAYLDIETGIATFRKLHALAAERIALEYASRGLLGVESHSFTMTDWFARLLAEGKAAFDRVDED